MMRISFEKLNKNLAIKTDRFHVSSNAAAAFVKEALIDM